MRTPSSELSGLDSAFGRLQPSTTTRTTRMSLNKVAATTLDKTMCAKHRQQVKHVRENQAQAGSVFYPPNLKSKSGATSPHFGHKFTPSIFEFKFSNSPPSLGLFPFPGRSFVKNVKCKIRGSKHSGGGSFVNGVNCLVKDIRLKVLLQVQTAK